MAANCVRERSLLYTTASLKDSRLAFICLLIGGSAYLLALYVSIVYCVNTISSIKPEVHDISQRHQHPYLKVVKYVQSLFGDVTAATLYQLLLPQSAASQNYNLRRRTHDKQLHQHQGHPSDCNFITKLLYKIHTDSITYM